MRLSDIKGEKALSVLADILDPVSEILTDKAFKALVSAKKTEKTAVVKYLLKNHAKQILTVLAILDDKDPATYEPDLLTLPAKLLEMLNDPALVDLFTSPGQNPASGLSGSVSENIEESDQHAYL